jgi:hypothetical protein
VVFETVSSAFNKTDIVSTHDSVIKVTSGVETARGVEMAEYQEILRFLASNPPHLDAEKKIHADLLEMLARKLKGEEINFDRKLLTNGSKSPFNVQRLR